MKWGPDNVRQNDKRERFEVAKALPQNTKALVAALETHLGFKTYDGNPAGLPDYLKWLGQYELIQNLKAVLAIPTNSPDTEEEDD